MIITSKISRTKVDTDKVEEVVRDLLRERFGDEYVFDPIEIHPRVFDDGENIEDYLELYIVFHGDLDLLPVSWTGRLTSLMIPAMLDMGWEYPVIKWIFSQEDWEEVLEDRKNDRI